MCSTIPEILRNRGSSQIAHKLRAIVSVTPASNSAEKLCAPTLAKVRENRTVVHNLLPIIEPTENISVDEFGTHFATIVKFCEQIQIVDFPDWRSPIMSSLCPFATGNKTSTTLNPTIIPGDFLEILLELKMK